MRILLDTNVLCCLAEAAHPHHAIAQTAIINLRKNGHELCLVPQVLYEYWVVVTRPIAENGLGMLPADAEKAIHIWSTQFTLFSDERGIFSAWRELVGQYDVRGKGAHDVRLVAAMQRHSLSHLLTFNTSEFKRFSASNCSIPMQLRLPKERVGWRRAHPERTLRACPSGQP